jgi:hypothetical protein
MPLETLKNRREEEKWRNYIFGDFSGQPPPQEAAAPSDHHRSITTWGGDSPAPAAPMCTAGHTPTQPPTCPLHPTKPYITPLPIFFWLFTHHPLILPPHSTKQTLEADQTIPFYPIHSHSVTHELQETLGRTIQFSLGQACKNTHRRPIRPDAIQGARTSGHVCPFCSSVFTTFHSPSHFHPFTKYLPHIPNTTTIHFPPPFHRSTFTISCHPLRHQELGSLEISWRL